MRAVGGGGEVARDGGGKAEVGRGGGDERRDEEAVLERDERLRARIVDSDLRR